MTIYNLLRLPIDLPDSPSVIEALSNPSIYERLATQFQQSPLQGPKNVFEKSSHVSTCGAGAECPSYEGKTATLNGREYNLYCINAPWGAYIWLPTAKSLEECEAQCHKNSYNCNGLTFYPSTGACSLIYSTDAEPYIWDNGYQKIGAIPAEAETAFGPGNLCPLPGSDNQVYDFGGNKEYQYKLSCMNQLNVPASAKKNIGTVKNVDECAEKAGEMNAYGFHYYQPIFPGGRYDGLRNCEIITQPVENTQFTPIFKPNQYLTGLLVKDKNCRDGGWNDGKQ